MAAVTITRIADGTYCVDHDAGNEIVYVAGPTADRWIFWNGQVFRGDFRAGEAERAEPDATKGRRPRAGADAGSDKVRPPSKVRPTSLTASMPARVSKLLARAGSVVKK